MVTSDRFIGRPRPNLMRVGRDSIGLARHHFGQRGAE